MRFIHIALFAAVLAASISFAAPQPMLQASPSKTVLEGWNCGPSGGPAQYYATIYIENPYNSIMQVNYSYYDYYTEGYVDGGRFCTISAISGQHCILSIPVRLGGEQAGESALSVRLYSTVDGMGGQASAELVFRLMHTPPSTETSVMGMIATTSERLSASAPSLESLCSKGACCGMAEYAGKLDSARASLSTANELVRQCRFTEAVASASNASANVNDVLSGYNATFKACRRALQAYSDAQGNATSVNQTILSRASCGINVSNSRTELAATNSLLLQAADLIRSDAYSDSLLYSEQARISANRSMDLSDSVCPPIGLQPETPPVASTPAPASAPIAPSSGDDALSGAFGALGYLVIAAIIIVVGAAIYVSLGKRHIDSFMSRAPKISEGFGSPPKPPAPKGDEVPPLDHSKVEDEFQDWLKSSGMDEKGEKKKGKAK